MTCRGHRDLRGFTGSGARIFGPVLISCSVTKQIYLTNIFCIDTPDFPLTCIGDIFDEELICQDRRKHSVFAGWKSSTVLNYIAFMRIQDDSCLCESL